MPLTNNLWVLKLTRLQFHLSIHIFILFSGDWHLHLLSWDKEHSIVNCPAACIKHRLSSTFEANKTIRQNKLLDCSLMVQNQKETFLHPYARQYTSCRFTNDAMKKMYLNRHGQFPACDSAHEPSEVGQGMLKLKINTSLINNLFYFKVWQRFHYYLARASREVLWVEFRQ